MMYADATERHSSCKIKICVQNNIIRIINDRLYKYDIIIKEK